MESFALLMWSLLQSARVLPAILWCATASAQVAISGRVIDETGVGISGARIELLQPPANPVVASSDAAGNFRTTLPGAGEYSVRVERLGFFLYTNRAQSFEA